MMLIILPILIIPVVLSCWNIFTFIRQIRLKQSKGYEKVVELIAIALGFVYTAFYLELVDVRFVGWNTAVLSDEKHGMLAPEYLPAFFIIIAVACLGFVVARFVPLHRQPPLVTVLCISAFYLGAVECIVWCVQARSEVLLLVFPLNLLLLFAKAVFILVHQKSLAPDAAEEQANMQGAARLLSDCANWPWLALVLMLPLLGVLLALLLLFGQQPDSIIKVWTETAGWTFSQRVAPPSIPHDAHYLCTVAANGHKRVVKPLRTGVRHGHRVLVNRQLCVANAFEQVLEEKLPKTHRVIRGVYDKTGYPISQHISSPYLCDVIYWAMKPLEWIFVAVLYLVDTKPENRIAIQYPHAPIPR